MRTKYLIDMKQMVLEREFHKISFYVKKLILTYAQLLLLLPQRFTYVQFSNQLYRPFQMRAWSCVTSYPLRGLPYLACDNVNPAMVNSMMLHSSMHDLKRSISSTKIFHPSLFGDITILTMYLSCHGVQALFSIWQTGTRWLW